MVQRCEAQTDWREQAPSISTIFSDSSDMWRTLHFPETECAEFNLIRGDGEG